MQDIKIIDLSEAERNFIESLLLLIDFNFAISGEISDGIEDCLYYYPSAMRGLLEDELKLKHTDDGSDDVVSADAKFIRSQVEFKKDTAHLVLALSAAKDLKIILDTTSHITQGKHVEYSEKVSESIKKIEKAIADLGQYLAEGQKIINDFGKE